MDIVLLLGGILIGGLIGYAIFYWRFENKELINELRNNASELRHTLHASERDRVEFEQQNIILREEIEQLYIKNDDLTQIVSELSRYYYHMKKVSSKMDELAGYLQQPLEDMDRKMKPFLYKPEDERHQEFSYTIQDGYRKEESGEKFF